MSLARAALALVGVDAAHTRDLLGELVTLAAERARRTP
jgi:hypothetical protein